MIRTNLEWLLFVILRHYTLLLQCLSALLPLQTKKQNSDNRNNNYSRNNKTPIGIIVITIEIIRKKTIIVTIIGNPP